MVSGRMTHAVLHPSYWCPRTVTLTHACIHLSSITNRKTQFLIISKPYMFRHRSTIFREPKNANNHKYNISLQRIIYVNSENIINGCKLVLDETFCGVTAMWAFWQWERLIPEVECWTWELCACRLPEDDTPVPKHVGVGAYHEMCFIICHLLYFIKCIC